MGNNEIKIFQNDKFGTVRTVMQNGEPWFVLKDACAALNINNHKMAAQRLDKDEVSHADLIDTIGRTQKTTIINESGLYSLTLRSDKPEAKEFKRWITHDVIPDIRKHGMYMTDNMITKVQQNPELIYIMADTLMKEHQKNQELIQSLEEAQPKVEYHDKVLMAPETLTITQIAKEYGKSGRKMNALLHEIGIQYKVNGQWVLYAKYANQGYTKDVTCQKEHDGIVGTYVNTQWTQKGRKFLYEELKQRNILPIQQAV